MKKYFINYSNHPQTEWSTEQTEAAEKYGTVVDLPFAEVPSRADSDDVALLADAEIRKILALRPAIVMCQGEMTLCYALVSRLLAQGIPVVAACSERCAQTWIDDKGNTCKRSVFVFRGFRHYR